jgi:hypothetical protein
MMTGVSAIAVRPGKRFWSGVAQRAVALVLVAAGIFALWYRQTYNVWPGQAASARVHWCGRDYQYQGPTQTWRQITSQARWPVRAVGRYPPLGLARQQLFAAVYPKTLRSPHSCVTSVYLRSGPGQYRTYSLEGGP